MSSPSQVLDIEAQPYPVAIPELAHAHNLQRKIALRMRTGNSENHGNPGKLSSMNICEAEKRRDRVMIENWKGEMSEIVVFASLFSATVSALIIERSKQSIPDSSDATVAWLVQVSQQFVNISNEMPVHSVTASPSNLSCKPIAASAIISDALLFLSLVLSLICVLSATLMQQWERHRPEFVQGRARTMSACIRDGAKRFRTSRRVKTISTLLRISVLLFFAGLLEPLLPMDNAPLQHLLLSMRC